MFNRSSSRNCSHRRNTHLNSDQALPPAVSEALEERLLLSGTHYVVDTLSMDIAVDGHISLPEALQAAYTNTICNEAPAGMNDGSTLQSRDEITFADELFTGGAVTVDTTSLQIKTSAESGQLKITGPGSDLLTLDASDSWITIEFHDDAELSGFTFINSAAKISHSNCIISDITQTGVWEELNCGLDIDSDSVVSLNNCHVSEGEIGLSVKGGSSVTVDDCTFDHNETGIYVADSNIELNDSIISDNYNTSGDYSAAVHLTTRATAKINNCNISGNSSRSDGGAIYVGYRVRLSLSNSTIADNSTERYGGGIACESVPYKIQITDCDITGNSANYGGGIYMDFILSRTTIQGLTFANNTANFNGGAILAVNADNGLTISDTEFINNTSGQYGGGICMGGETETDTHASGGELTLESVVFERNGSMTAGGGIFFDDPERCYISNSQFVANYSGKGAAFASTENDIGSIIWVSNSRFYGNCANTTGGVFYGTGVISTQNIYVGNQANYGAILSLGEQHFHSNWLGISDTMASNVALDAHDALFYGKAEVYASLFYNNTAAGQPNIINTWYEGIFKGSYNFFDVLDTETIVGEGNISGTVNEPVDPMFTANPGPGETPWGNSMGTPWIDETLDNYYGDLNLQAGSPAIATEVLPVEQLQQIALDINGNARWLGAGPDYGAIEYTGQSETAQYELSVDGQQVTTDQVTIYFSPLLADTTEVTVVINYNNTGQLPVYITAEDTWSQRTYTISAGQNIDDSYTLKISALAALEIDITSNSTSPLAYSLNWMATAIGDASLDGTVDLDDFITLKQHYGNSEASWADGDFNGDGNIDLDDFILLKQNYGTTAAESAAAAEAAAGAPASTTDQQSPSEAVAAVAMKAPTLNLTTDLSWQAPSITLANSETFDCLAAAAMAS